MRHYFTTEGPELLVYDDVTEHWRFKGKHAGAMSLDAAKAIMWGLRRDEMQAEDAADPSGSVAK